jgi:CHAT domain-containing protein/Tfp pilus assembly protein PilF
MAGDLTEPAPRHDPSDLAAMGEDAHRLLGEDPARARDLAGRALEGALSGRLHETASVALRALGLAAMDLDDVPTAVLHLRAAIDSARRAGSAQRVAEARMSLAHALLNQGDSTAALRQAGLAMRDVGARDATLARQHALILDRLGRADEALDGYRRALALVRRSGDSTDVVAVLCNRGVLQAYRGALRAAESDLREAEQLARAIGKPLYVAIVQGNLGWLATRRGDLPSALASFDAAEPVLAGTSAWRRAVMEMDRCHALLAAGLQREARSSAGQVVELFAASDMGAELAEARLALAEAALACREPEAALEAAEDAKAAFARQQRPGWASLAEHLAVRAAFGGGSRDGELHTRARRVADELAAAGWPSAALDARLLAAHVALALRQDDDAAADLAAIPRARNSGPVAQRLGAWHAEALRRLAAGRRTAALRALRAGLAVLEQHRLSLGATELRAGAAVHGNALAALGLRLALASGRAEAVFAWAERGRAAALWQRPARPPDDDALAADLGELRMVLAAVGDAGKHAADTRGLLRRQAELEAAIRRRALHAAAARSDGDAGAEGPPGQARLRAALGERALVEFVQDGRLLCAVVVTAAQRPRLVMLGETADELARELAGLRTALRRLARGTRSDASRAIARENAEHAAKRLDELLLAPLAARIGDRDRELVLVPTGELHAVPWAALPSCASRATSVAPSAALWLRAAIHRTLGGPAPEAGGSLALVAGPGLPHAEAEVAALAGRHPGATVLTPASATVASVAAALETAQLAHVASHGTFRADNPLFSALELTDGPLTVYDLERLRSAPRDMVLSACDAGVTAVRPGDELMGFSGALLSLGTSALVASVVPVPDEPTRRLMLALHERLAAGCEPAAALAQARVDALDTSDADYAAAVGFVCFGAGSAAAPA